MNIEIFEVPMTECDPDYEPEGSGDSYFCQFGGEEDPRSDYFDDEEFLADCQCNGSTSIRTMFLSGIYRDHPIA